MTTKKLHKTITVGGVKKEALPAYKLVEYVDDEVRGYYIPLEFTGHYVAPSKSDFYEDGDGWVGIYYFPGRTYASKSGPGFYSFQNLEDAERIQRTAYPYAELIEVLVPKDSHESPWRSGGRWYTCLISDYIKIITKPALAKTSPEAVH